MSLLSLKKTSLLVLLLLPLACLAQVEMREPPPRRSKFSKFYINADDVDYNMKTPLSARIGYPCRKTAPGPTQGALVAGQDLKVFFDGTATRQGGDCQFAISYDNGTNFAVIWDKLDNCFLDTVNGGYEVPIPDRLPAAKDAVFAWTWIPAVGDRSFYMNCADVRIENYGKQEPYMGKELLAINVPGKLTVLPKKFEAKDTLPGLFEERKTITVGHPIQSKDVPSASGERVEDSGDGEVKEEGGDDDDSSETGVVILYVSETTTTTTDMVFVTDFVTEEDTDFNGQYTYGNGIQTRGQLSTTLGPLAKPLYGTNVGLTIEAGDESSTTGASFMSFTNDLPNASPSSSNKWLDSQEYFPPSVRTSGVSGGLLDKDLMNPWPSTSTSATPDILSSGNSKAKSGIVPDMESGSGTMLFTSATTTDPLAAIGELSTSNRVTTNRPNFHSVTNAASHLSPFAVSEDHLSLPTHFQHAATTVFSTVTKDGKPMLQVVVSMDSSASIPQSLTLAY